VQVEHQTRRLIPQRARKESLDRRERLSTEAYRDEEPT